MSVFKIKQEVHNDCYLHDEVFLGDGGALLVVSVGRQLLYKQTERQRPSHRMLCETPSSPAPDATEPHVINLV